MGFSARRTLAAAGVAVLVAVNGVASPEAELPTAEPTTAPEYGGVLVYVCGADPYPSDSFWDQGRGDCNLVSGVLDKLLVSDWARNRDELNHRAPFLPINHMTGGLVQSWELSTTELVLYLRDGIYWHNKEPLNGRKFTSADLASFLETAFVVGNEGDCAAGNTCRQLGVESVSHTTNPTVTLHLKQPSFIELGEILDSRYMFIYPPELLQHGEESFDWRALVGTGPLMLESYIKEDSITWLRNPNYWGFDEKFPENSLPYVDEVRALIMPDAQARKAAFLTGQIDYLGIGGTYVRPDTVEEFSKMRDVRSWDTWVNSVNAFRVNVNRAPLDQPDVRAALQMALDLEKISETVFDRRSDLTPQGQVGYFLTDYYIPFDAWPPEIQARYAYDPTGAEQLLDDAGFPPDADGIRFRTNLYTLANRDGGYAEAAAKSWSDIGVFVSVEVLDREAFIQIEREFARFDGFIATTAAAQFFDERLATQWYRADPYNPVGVDDPTIDAMIDGLIRARHDHRTERYRELFREIDLYAINQHWVIWGPAVPRIRVTQPWVKGYNGEYHLGRSNTNALFARLWIDGELKDEMN